MTFYLGLSAVVFSIKLQFRLYATSPAQRLTHKIFTGFSLQSGSQ
jgi:hypothetical protein